MQTAQAESARIDALVAEASAELDALVASEEAAQERLSSRARVMYRMGDPTFISMLLGAESFQDFVARWDLMVRMNERDAADIDSLKTAQAEAEEAAKGIMALQIEQARAAEKAEREVARAREELAESEAALREYEAKLAEQKQQQAAAAKPTPAAPAAPTDSNQQLTGTGAWQTGVASHYGRNFSGRGASGKSIGPYSMMVAHNTLPFGTLIEFEYNGKRAVASVEDRGPHVAGRMFDLGPGVVRALGFSGVHEVRYRVIRR